MSWYYADNGRQAGPVDEATFDSLIRQGSIRQDTLVWKEGMSNWQPLGTVRPPAPAPAPAPIPVPAPPPAYQAPDPQPAAQSYQPQPSFQPQQQPFQPQPSYQPQQPQSYQPQPSYQPQQPSGGGVTCANCGQSFAASDVVFIGNSYVCAGCKPVFLQRMRESGAQSTGARRYGGFWIRFAAALIDGIIIGVAGAIITYPITFAVASVFSNAFMIIAVSSLLTLVRMALGAAYSGYFISTKGATPGKQLLGLQVIRSDGSPVTFTRGACRYLAQIVSALILLLGYIIAAFDNERRTLHDHLCDTRVVYR